METHWVTVSKIEQNDYSEWEDGPEHMRYTVLVRYLYNGHDLSSLLGFHTPEERDAVGPGYQFETIRFPQFETHAK